MSLTITVSLTPGFTVSNSAPVQFQSCQPILRDRCPSIVTSFCGFADNTTNCPTPTNTYDFCASNTALLRRCWRLTYPPRVLYQFDYTIMSTQSFIQPGNQYMFQAFPVVNGIQLSNIGSIPVAKYFPPDRRLDSRQNCNLFICDTICIKTPSFNRVVCSWTPGSLRIKRIVAYLTQCRNAINTNLIPFNTTRIRISDRLAVSLSLAVPPSSICTAVIIFRYPRSYRRIYKGTLQKRFTRSFFSIN